MAGWTAAELRREFDAGFALPIRTAHSDREHFLAIRAAGRPYALRVAEIGAVAMSRRVTPLPSRRPALLGLVGVRGAVVPVYDLARLLGDDATVSAPRWFALSGGAEPIAFAFAELEGHLRLQREALESAGGGFVSAVIRDESGLRPVVGLTSLVRSLRTEPTPPSAEEGA